MALWARVFLGCVGEVLSTAAFLMNSIDWPEPTQWYEASSFFLFSLAPVIYQVEGQPKFFD